MQAPSKKIKLQISGLEVEVKEWITAREAEEIERIIYSAVEAKPNNRGTIDFSKINPEVVDEQTHKEIEKFVLSVNGSPVDVIKIILDLPEADYKQIKNEIKDLRENKKKDLDLNPEQSPV